MPRTIASATIRPNHETRWPNRYAFVSVQAAWQPAGGEHAGAEVFVCATLQHETRLDRESTFTVRETCDVHTPGDLWAKVDSWKRSKTRTVLVAANVGRLLQVSDAFRQLTALGWEFGNGMIDYGRAWCTWKHGRTTLVITDLASWCSLSVRKQAALMGHDGAPFDEFLRNNETHADRAHAEVAVVAASWHRMREWCEREDCGMWRPTGAGQSFATYRHRFLHKGIVHHGDEDLYARERAAVWTGRCEAWRVGRVECEYVDEWDLSLAYARIGRDAWLPYKVLGTAATIDPRKLRPNTMGLCTLADCTITTDVPTVPTYVDGRITWPVGTFTTTLWDPEIRLALKHGAQIECTNVVRYVGAPMLRDWGTWIINLLEGADKEPDPIVYAMLKSWARTVVGRFGLRYATWEPIGVLDPPQFGGWSGGPIGEHTRQRLMALGSTMFQEGPLEESPDSAPAVMGWIMSECRRRVYETMHRVGAEHVLYVDTDGVLLDPRGSARMDGQRDRTWRRKHRYSSVDIIGPRQLVLGREVKAAGVPFRARVTHGHKWEGEVESSPFGALRAGTTGTLAVRSVRGTLRPSEDRRRVRRDGSTRPVSIAS